MNCNPAFGKVSAVRRQIKAAVQYFFAIVPEHRGWRSVVRKNRYFFSTGPMKWDKSLYLCKLIIFE